MTPDDLELTVRLARWMGWTEDKDGPDDAPEITYTVDRDRGEVFLVGGECRHPYCDWKPLREPEQAAEVMAEAVRQGLRVEATVCGASGYATAFACRPRYDEPASMDVSRHLFVDVRGGYHEERGNFAAGWCRAVCLAVLAAAEGGV